MRKQIDKIKVSAGEDLLAFIPHMVGYWPERSIVCIGMSGKRLRATMRLDLPPDDPAVDLARFAAIAASQLASDVEADGCLIAIFGDEDWLSPETPPHAQVHKALCMAFEEFELPVRDSWFVGLNHWRSLECDDAQCCPWPGKDNASIKESFVNAEFIFRGSMVRNSPREQIKDLVALRDPKFAEAVTAAGTDLKGPLALAGSGAHQLAVTLGAWEYSLSRWPVTPDPAMAAYLLASLAEGTVRDAVIVALAATPRHAMAGAAALGLVPLDSDNVKVPRNWHGGNQASGSEIHLDNIPDEEILLAGEDFARILVGEVAAGANASGRRGAGAGSAAVRSAGTGGPDWARLDVAEPLLQFLAGSTQSADKAPVLCLLGWIQWCKGHGTWAGSYFQACQDHQPGYRLASMLEQLLAAGHIAECAKNPRTAWRGYGEKEAPDEAA
ncbi:MAG: DUF4192 domain-containing protein [Specibacter sp.]